MAARRTVDNAAYKSQALGVDPGDLNCDGAVNFGDIDRLVALLSSGATCP